MTISNLQAIELAKASYLLTWTSDLVRPLFYVYVAGELIRTTRLRNLTVELIEGEFPTIEISENKPLLPQGGQATVELEWPAVPNARHYRVEEFENAAWTTRSVIKDDGSGTFSHRTLPTGDETNAQFRVTAVGLDGNESTPATVTLDTPRHPPMPEVDYTYDDALHQITLTEI